MCGSEKVLDPITGQYIVSECDCEDGNCDCEDCEEHGAHATTPTMDGMDGTHGTHGSSTETTTTPPTKPPTDNKQKLKVLLSDLYTPDCTCQCINLAALYNYSNVNYDSIKFGEVNLPELNIDYRTFVKIFFNDYGKGFSSHILNKIWKGIRFSLANTVLEHYEELEGKDRDTISPVNMIKLNKECAFNKITGTIRRQYALNQSEFQLALGSVDLREDGNICSNIIFYMLFESLQIGLKITLRFAISDVPKELIGTMVDEEHITYSWDDVSSVHSEPISIVLDDC